MELTILTPCLDRVDFIGDAIESVLSQWRDGLEHVIIDGGSTDGTLDLLNKYDHLTVISEPDENLYDAVNKGLSIAKGGVIGWLNSDDRYLASAFDMVLPIFRDDPSVEMVCGGTTMVSHRHKDGLDGFYLNGECNKNLDYHDLLFEIPIINARFFRKSLFDRIGFFDIRYPPASDREFLLRCAMEEAKFISIDQIVHEYLIHDQSGTIKRGLSHWTWMADVHIAIVEDYLGRDDIPKELRRELRRFHAKNSLMGAVAEFSEHKIKNGISYMSKGISTNGLWPALAVWYVFDWLLRKSRQKIGSWS